MQKHEIGREGERMAEEYLCSLGWNCLGRNVRFKSGEIDLIFEVSTDRGLILALVEVRMRRAGAWVSPGESLVGAKSRRLLRAGQLYLNRYRGAAREVRFDLVAIEGGMLRHFPGFLEGE